MSLDPLTLLRDATARPWLRVRGERDGQVTYEVTVPVGWLDEARRVAFAEDREHAAIVAAARDWRGRVRGAR